MEHRQVHHAVLLNRPAPKLLYSLDPQHLLDRDVAEEGDIFRIDFGDLLVEPEFTSVHLAFRRGAVVRRAAGNGVSDEKVFTVQAGVLEHLIKELAGAAYEWNARVVLAMPWCLTYQHDVSLLRPGP